MVKRTPFSTKDAVPTEYPYRKMVNSDSYLTLYHTQKLTSGGLKTTVKTGNYKILEENREKKLFDTSLGNDFF